MNILCLGGSYTGRYLASRFSTEHQITFLSRNVQEMLTQGYTAVRPEGLQELSKSGVDAVLDRKSTRLNSSHRL